MIQFSENIYGGFLHHQCYESVDLCNYLFAHKSVRCFVLLLLLKHTKHAVKIIESN